MKLELKHLAPYLPYGLKVKNVYSKSRIPDIVELNCENYYEMIVARQRLPILHPLSDLTKEIEVNGQRFVPIEVLNEVDGEYYILDKDELFFEDICNLNLFELHRCYDVIIKLFEWHFDVFNLIPEGLAIDINTLSK